MPCRPARCVHGKVTGQNQETSTVTAPSKEEGEAMTLTSTTRLACQSKISGMVVGAALGVALGSIGFSVGATSPAAAAELKKIAILIPEEPTDYGWNQQGFEAAKAVAAKYGFKFLPANGLGLGGVHFGGGAVG